MSSPNEAVQRIQSIQRDLCCLQARRRAIIYAGRGAFYGSVLAIVVAVVQLLANSAFSPKLIWLNLILIPLFAVGGVLFAYLRKNDALQAARALDSAANSDDRFASALQLADHHQKTRVDFVVADALAHIASVPIERAIQIRSPREVKWLAASLAAFALIAILLPSKHVTADATIEPPIHADDWQAINDEFRDELDRDPKPESEEEREVVREMNELAECLAKKPTRTDALSAISKMRAAMDSRQQKLNRPETSLQRAAQSINSSTMLSQFMAMLQQGNYQEAAKELQDLAKSLAEDKKALSAEQFDAAAADLEQLAKEMKSQDELSKSCRNCANAASSMNRQSLSDALKKFSESLNKNADKLKQCDRLSNSKSKLDKLSQRLSQRKSCSKCSKCKSGNCQGNCPGSAGAGNQMAQGQGKQGGKKGGLKAGWGSAQNWSGGAMQAQSEERTPDMIDLPENEGEITTTQITSPEERARTAMELRELFANMVKKQEADLGLEAVPPEYRDYLRRYFVSIRPEEDSTDAGASQPE